MQHREFYRWRLYHMRYMWSPQLCLQVALLASHILYAFRLPETHRLTKSRDASG